MIQQKSKPNREKLGLKDVTIDVRGLAPDYVQQKNTILSLMPQVYYYGVELHTQNITKLTVDSNKYLPMCYICYNDIYGVMHDVGFPSDNAKLTVVLPANHNALANIFLEFKIQKYEVDILRGSNGKKVHMWGILNVENLLIKEYKAYPATTSFDMIQNMAQSTGLGFMSNCDGSSDAMTWLNPGMNNYQFLQDAANKAWVGESGFVWSFVDFFYNLNYIDVEKSLSQDLTELKWISTNVLGDTDTTLSPVRTNEASQKGSNNYFSGEKILNQSTDISLKRGYLRNVYFYDTDGNWESKAGAYKRYGLDTITSTGTQNNSILLKGDPGSVEFYNKNQSFHYLDKIDTQNMYPDYLWAMVQNSENLFDLQKIVMQIVLPVPNFNIRRFEKVRLLFTNNNIGVKANQRNMKLNGEWLVTGVTFEWNGRSMYQYVSVVKRELNVGEI